MAPWTLTVSGALLLLGLGASFAPGMEVAPELAALFVFGSVAGVVLAVAATAPALPWRALALLAAPAALLAAAHVLWGGGAAVGAAMLTAAALLFGGTLLGAVIGGQIEHPGHLSLVAFVSAFADLSSVMSKGGVTAAIVENKPVLALLAISWPVPGTDAIAPVLGVGDVVMAALYLSAVRRHGLGVGRTLAALGAAFFALFVVLFVGERALPALPFFSLAVLAAHPSVLRIRPEERRAATAGMLIVLALAVYSLTR